jgi:glycosyltransferase involved in cell wall biosynthesis
MNAALVLSVVSPLFNEEGSIGEFSERAHAACAALKVSFEILLVDDGSRDGTWEAIREAGRRHPEIRGIRLSRNFGGQHALMAGYSAARGDAIITLDGDLQHPPALFPEMIAAWRKGFDIVKTRKNPDPSLGLWKRLTSKAFYRVFSFLSDVPMGEGSSDFRLIDRRVRDQILTFRDTNLFLRGAVEWVGFKSTTLAFDVEPRFSGVSKFTFPNLMRLATSAIVSFSLVPLRIGIWIGFLTAFLSFCELGFVVLAYFKGWSVPGWASTVGIISLLFGIMFVLLGIIGAYIARIHQALMNRPPFIIAETFPAPEKRAGG